MSLGIFFVSIDININSDFLEKELEKEVYKTNNYVFGFEKFRKSLWGHEIIKVLGCEIIYSLREYDIYVFGEDIIKLKNELFIILNNIELIVAKTEMTKETIEERVRNALTYIKYAEKHIDKIGITIG